jgi:hypothetical protein
MASTEIKEEYRFFVGKNLEKIVLGRRSRRWTKLKELFEGSI